MSLDNDTKPSADSRQEEINWLPEMSLSSPIDVISTSTWSADKGLSTSSPTKAASSTAVTISGGRLGAYCNLVNTVVTTAGYTYTKTLIVEIVPT